MENYATFSFPSCATGLKFQNKKLNIHSDDLVHIEQLSLTHVTLFAKFGFDIIEMEHPKGPQQGVRFSPAGLVIFRRAVHPGR